MNGRREPQQLSLSTPVIETPATHARELLRAVDELIDFEFVYEKARPYFADGGRPSIDPVVMIKLMLTGYLLDIESDRRLVDEAADRLSVREFLGYLTDEPMPAHSSFTEWRKRFGPDFFRDILHEIVRQCEAHGMTLSGARCVDGTRIKSQAGRGGPKIEVPRDVDVPDYLEQYFSNDPPPEPPPDTGKGTIPINTHDPDARLDARPNERTAFVYYGSFSSDPESGLVTDTSANAREKAGTAVDHVDHDPGDVNELAGDILYDDAATLAALQERDVTCYMPERTEPTGGKLGKSHFRYDAKRDVYICPAGKELKRSRYHKQRDAHFYTAKISDCKNCPHKSACTDAKRRSVSRLELQDARDATVRSGPRYDHMQRRRTIAEHLNLLGKRDHALSRARGLGLAAMRIQMALVGTAINLKKLVRHAGLRPSDAFSCASAALVVLVWASRAWFGLWSALSGGSWVPRARSSAAAFMRTILPRRITGPQLAANRGF
jgi:transposase